MTAVDITQVQVIAPNFKRRLSGVTATVVRLVPVQARDINIAACAPIMPDNVPQMPLHQLITMPRSGPDGPRVWHARRNVEMIAGLALKHLLRKRLKLMFTSASQRKQTGLTRWLIRQMDTVVATSDRTADYLEGPSEVIMHGIDTDDFAPPADRTALRAALGLPTDGPLIGCYGRIRSSKGTDIFATAVAPFLNSTPNAHALIMGRATEKDRAFLQTLKDDIAKQGLEDRILFMPEVSVEAMADWYRILDLYVAPQRWEGFGLTPIEAMACGTPVIATRVGAFDKIVVNGTGALIAPNDPDALAMAITSAFTPPRPIDVWAKATRPHVKTHFSITREATDLIQIYRKLLQTRN